MDITTSLHKDSIHGVTDKDPETPHQDPQKTCTRNSPCLQQGCMICCTPITPIRNLNVALNGSNASPTSLTMVDRPQSPDNHPMFQDTIHENDIFELTTANNLYTQAINSTMDFSLYDRSNLVPWDVNTMEFLSTDMRAWTVTIPHPLPSPSWDPTDLFPWLNP